MERIWAPWRIEYIRKKKSEGCILCEILEQDEDVANYILYRGAENAIILNSYPYNPGHLMVVPHKHIASLEDLTEKERNEHFKLVSQSIRVLRQAFNPGGFNVGINLGKIAGAGIDGHVHTHIVPRWQGDVNFMPVLAETRVVSEALVETYQKLAGKF